MSDLYHSALIFWATRLISISLSLIGFGWVSHQILVNHAYKNKVFPVIMSSLLFIAINLMIFPTIHGICQLDSTIKQPINRPIIMLKHDTDLIVTTVTKDPKQSQQITIANNLLATQRVRIVITRSKMSRIKATPVRVAGLNFVRYQLFLTPKMAQQFQ